MGRSDGFEESITGSPQACLEPRAMPGLPTSLRSALAPVGRLTPKDWWLHQVRHRWREARAAIRVPLPASPAATRLGAVARDGDAGRRAGDVGAAWAGAAGA